MEKVILYYSQSERQNYIIRLEYFRTYTEPLMPTGTRPVRIYER